MILITAVVALLMLLVAFIPFKNNKQTFSARQATLDIRGGHVRLITFRIAGPSAQEQKIASQYGVTLAGMGCLVGYNPEQREYDSLVRAYLDERNGRGWYVRFYREVDSLNKIPHQ